MSQNSIWNPDLQSCGDNHTTEGWILRHRGSGARSLPEPGETEPSNFMVHSLLLISNMLPLPRPKKGFNWVQFILDILSDPKGQGNKAEDHKWHTYSLIHWNSRAPDKSHHLSVRWDSSFITDRLTLLPRQMRVRNTTNGHVELQGSNFSV